VIIEELVHKAPKGLKVDKDPSVLWDQQDELELKVLEE
jgi:hypothetical protein